MKLNIGAGGTSLPGFLDVDRKSGDEAYPLVVRGTPIADGSVEAIVASHVLEHFPHGQVEAVVRHWIAKLKPGGTLKVAVPDFGEIARSYVAGGGLNVQGYVMGGQVDADDQHRSLFDRTSLRRLLGGAGLCLLRDWHCDDPASCASLPISLNLEGTKPHRHEIRIRAVMSAPRLGFLDMMFCALEALPPLGIPFVKVGGAFWGQSLTKGLEGELAAAPDYLLTLDYDSIFGVADVATLAELAMCHPEWDAIAPLQANRHTDAPLFTLAESGDREGNVSIAAEYFAPELVAVPTAHFGLTLLKADKLAALPKPWFHSEPDPQGGWDTGKKDDDMRFWREWRKAGNSLGLATRVQIGHAQLMVRWLDGDLRPIWQTAEDWNARRAAPDAAWSGPTLEGASPCASSS